MGIEQLITNNLNTDTSPSTYETERQKSKDRIFAEIQRLEAQKKKNLWIFRLLPLGLLTIILVAVIGTVGFRQELKINTAEKVERDVESNSAKDTDLTPQEETAPPVVEEEKTNPAPTQQTPPPPAKDNSGNERIDAAISDLNKELKSLDKFDSEFDEAHIDNLQF